MLHLNLSHEVYVLTSSLIGSISGEIFLLTNHQQVLIELISCLRACTFPPSESILEFLCAHIQTHLGGACACVHACMYLLSFKKHQKKVCCLLSVAIKYVPEKSMI